MCVSDDQTQNHRAAPTRPPAMPTLPTRATPFICCAGKSTRGTTHPSAHHSPLVTPTLINAADTLKSLLAKESGTTWRQATHVRPTHEAI